MGKDIQKNMENESFEFKLSSTTEKSAEKQIVSQQQEKITAQNGYNLDLLTRENERLTRQLNDSELWQEHDERFAQRDKQEMQTRIIRNDMILLYNDENGSQDSEEMQDIKRGLVELDATLRQIKWDASEVFTSYNRVISYMRNYEMTKKPFFSAGKRRLARVSALRASLEKERDTFMGAMSWFKGEIPEAIKTPMDVLKGKHIGGVIDGGAEERLAVRKRKLLGLKRENGKADGEQMRNIKDTFKKLYSLLERRIAPENEGEQQKNEILDVYRVLIEDCRSYIKDHNPSTLEGKERLAFVQALMQRSEIEQYYIASLAAEQVAQKGENALWADAFGEADAMAENYVSATNEIVSVFSDRTAPAKALTFIYSLSVVSDSDKTKHKILSNDIAQAWYKTYMNEERYKEMFLYSEKLKADIAELYRNEVRNPVPVRFLKDRNMDPMDTKSREAYARLCLRDHPKVKLYRGLNFALSKYIDSNSQGKGENSLKEQGNKFIKKYRDGLSEQEISQNMEDGKIAFAISRLEGMSVLNDEAVASYKSVMENKERSECKENLKEFVSSSLLDLEAGEKKAADKSFEEMKKDEVWGNAEAVFEKAGALGVSIPVLNDEQKSKLRECDPSLLGKEIRSGLEFIKDALSHYGDEAVSAYDTNKNDIYYKVAAKTMLRFCNITDDGDIAAQYELSRFLSETIFELAGKQALKEVSEKAYIGDLAAVGAGGIFDVVKEKRDKVEAWNDKKEQVDMGVTRLAELCNDLHELSDLFARAFVVGLTDEEAGRVKVIGEKIDTLLSSEEDIKVMDLVAKELKGMRYETGFASVKTLFAGGFRYREAADKIARDLTLSADEQQRLKEQEKDAFVIIESEKKTEKESEKETENTDSILEGVLNVLDAKVVPSVLIDNLPEKEKNQAPAIAAGYIEMQKALRSFRPGEKGTKDITVGKTPIRLVHHDDGSVDLISGQKVTALSNNASFMAERLESDITSNIRIYGKDVAYEIIVANEKSGLAGKTALRTMCLHAIEGVSSFAGSYFNNVSTDEVIRISKYLLKGGMTEEQVRQYVVSVEDSALINGEETLTLLKDMEKQKDAADFVVFKPQLQQADKEDGWTKEERGVINLVSDLIFTQDTWVADETRMQPGERIQKIILKQENMDTLVYMIQNKYNNGLDKMLEKLNIPETIKTTIKNFIDVYLGDKKIEADVTRLENLEGQALYDEVARMQEEMEQQQLYKDKLKNIIEAGDEKKDNKSKGGFLDAITKFVGKAVKFGSKAMGVSDAEAKNKAVEAALRLAIVGITVHNSEAFADLEKKIDEQVEETSQEVQKKVSKNVNVLFGGKLEVDEQEEQDAENDELEDEEEEEDEQITKLELDMEKPLDPNEKGISDTEKTRREEYKKKYKKESAKKLGSVITENYVTGKRGQGKFMKLVLKRYFGGVSTLDKRSMMASAIRATKPKVILPPDATEEQKRQAERAVMGIYLGGILKGAGPLLQKMLQGVPIIGLPKELQSALEDMKSRLAPIPPQIVKAQMLDMVKRSNGRVTKIEVTRALGAASVGQTFLCKMYGPGFEKGKDVVVKLLRPDVRNRMMREKALMRSCAKDTDKKGGMLATYEGQLLRIEEELDLTIEAANVEKGICYDKHCNTVKGMKVDHTIDPTANSMLLEKAPGTTLDAYMKSVAQEKEEIMSQFYQYRETTVNGKTVKEPIMTEIQGEEMIKINFNAENSSKILEAQEKIRTMLERLQKRQKYMADLARIWIEEGIFKNGFYHGDLHAGNIMIDDEKVTVIDFGNATKLDEEQQLHVTRMILSAASGNVSEFQKGFHALLKGANPKVLEAYDEKKDQLTQVFSEVMKLGDATTAGERIGACLIRAQELGVAIPAAINNFAQSQLRIQNALAEMNEQIRDLQRCAEQINGITGGFTYSPCADIGAILHSNMLKKDNDLSKVIPQFKKEMQGEIDRERIKNDFLKSKGSNTFESEHLTGIYDVSISIEKLKDFMDVVRQAANDDIGVIMKQQAAFAIQNDLIRLGDYCDRVQVNKIRNLVSKILSSGYTNEIEQEFNAAVNALDPDKIIENTKIEYLKLRNLKADATQEEKDNQMNAFLDKLAVARKKQYILGNESLVTIRHNLAIYDKEKTVEQINKELEPYFNDLENGGAIMRKVYKEIRDAQDRLKDVNEVNKDYFVEVEAKKIDELLVLLHKCGVKQLDSYEQRVKKGVDLKSNPDDFFDIMGEVLFANKYAAIRRLGGFFAAMWKYRSLMKMSVD